MTPDQQVKLYTAAIKKMLSDKHKGYKTVGSVAGGALGAGIGSATGLVKAINKHRSGEMDDLDTIDKAKEYLKSVGGHAGIGLGAGAALGAGAGELGKRWSANGPLENVLKNLKIVAKDAPENTGKAGKYMYREIKKEIPEINLSKNVKDKILAMLTKKNSDNTPRLN